MTAVETSTMKQLRKKFVFASFEFAAHFHAQSENWRETEMILCQKTKESWQFAQKKREGNKHRADQCNDPGGKYKCMRCRKRTKHLRIPSLNVKLKKCNISCEPSACLLDCARRSTVCFDPARTMRLRFVRPGRKMLVWCRTCWGYTGVRLGEKTSERHGKNTMNVQFLHNWSKAKFQEVRFGK